MKKINYKWLFLFLIPLAVFFKVHNSAGYQYASTAGDFYGVIDPENTIISNSFAFRSNLNQGYADNTANLFSNNSSYLIYELALSKLGFSQLSRTYILIFLLSIFGFVSMYRYLSKKYSVNNSSKHSHFFISIIYGFSPYFITYVAPGHFLFMTLFAFFPLVQLYFEGIIDATKTNFYLSLKYFAQLSFVLFLICIAFANLGVFAIFILLMIGQLIIQFFLRQISIKQLLQSAAIFSLSCFIANIWWIAPQIASMTSVAAMESQSKQTIGNSINYVTQNSNILNIISGFPEGVGVDIWFSFLQIFLLLLFILLLITSLKNKQKINIGFLLIILLTIFFTKGPNAPFGDVFDFLYSKIALFQVIRRPASKLYWIIIFFILSLGYSIIVKNKNKFLSTLLDYLLGFTAVLTIYVTLQNINLNPFNIPDSYYQANQYLIKSHVKKILLLPDLGGLSPDYNRDLNYHKGVDFLGQIWEFKKYIPSSSNWTISDSESDIVNLMTNKIYSGQDICDISRDLNVSHVVIRKDLLPTNYNQTLLDKAEESLSRSKNISETKQFGNSFNIFKINNECQTNLVSSDSSTTIKYQKINPTKIKINISSPQDRVEIIFREKYDKGWLMYAGSITNKVMNHESVLNYANGWTVDIPALCSKTKGLCTRSGNNYSFDLYIEYWPQWFYYFGLLITGSMMFLCIFYLLKHQHIEKL